MSEIVDSDVSAAAERTGLVGIVNRLSTLATLDVLLVGAKPPVEDTHHPQYDSGPT